MDHRGDLHQRDQDPDPEGLGPLVVVLLICVLVGGYWLFHYLGHV